MICGCSGTWIYRYQWTVDNNYYEGPLAGFEQDNPFVFVPSGNNTGPLYIKSACDGRLMEKVTNNAFTVVNVTFTWQPGPGCQPPQIHYDCINGACLPKTSYGTPGIYPSLSACEIACGTGCSGKCISNADWAQIEGLSSELKSTNCLIP